MKRIILFSLVLLQALAAKSEAGLLPDRHKDEIVQALMQRNYAFSWLSGRCRADILFDGENMSGAMHFRLRKDSVILVSVRKFGIEAAKVFADTANYTILYKLEGTYESGSISKLSEQYGLQANLEDLQQLIAGNVLLPDSSGMTVTSDTLYGVVKGTVMNMRATYYLSKEDMLLKKMTLRDKMNRNSTLLFDDYRQVEGVGMVAFQRDLEYEGENGMARIHINIDEMTYNTPVDVRFSLPSHYEKIN